MLHGTRSVRRALLLAALALFAGRTATAAPAQPHVRHVVIVSLDGGKPAVMRRSPMPVLEAMVRDGATTWNATTIHPSTTLPAHTSMLTGLLPARHKMTWDDWKPELGLVHVPTIFQLAHRQGMTTAMFVAKAKFRHLDVPGTLDRFEIPGYTADRVAVAAAAYIRSAKPNLLFVHFGDSDSAGHRYGWGSPEQVASFAAEDSGLGELRRALRDAGIADDTVIIVTADHGGHGHSHGTALPADMTIPWIASGAGVARGRTITAPVNTCDTAATALWLLGVPAPRGLDGRPVTSAFR